MIERGLPIDIVISADIGMEFPEMYEHFAKVDAYLYQKEGCILRRCAIQKGLNGSCLMNQKANYRRLKNAKQKELC